MEMKAAAATGHDLWAYDKDSDTCISCWVRLAGGKYQEMLKPLNVRTQKGPVPAVQLAPGFFVSTFLIFFDLYSVSGHLIHHPRLFYPKIFADALPHAKR